MGKKAREAEEGAMEPTKDDSKRAAGPAGPGAASEAVQQVRAQALLGARGILRIEHHGEVYTLWITRNDRLILTK